MRLSKLQEIPESKDVIDTFGGYNHNVRINDGEFFDMRNLSSSHYPVLSPRGRRGTYRDTESPNGLLTKDVLCYVDGTKLYLGDDEVQGLTLTDTPKQLISFGAYIIIMPDKKYVNTKDLSDKGDIEAEFTSSSSVSYELCRVNGERYAVTYVQAVEPTAPNDLDLWIDTSSEKHVLKQYAASSQSWVTIATTYVKIKATGIGASFAPYDGATLTGIDPSLTELAYLEGQTSVLYDAVHDASAPENDYIVVTGIIDGTYSQSAPITVKRQMPIMDFVIESENRLWGCRYGANINGDIVNEIYASKLGDFKNWNCYQGISTDSYTASCGTDGEWTGAITHLGHPCFFKETCLHKVYGNYPSNFQVQTTSLRGVQKGAGNSLAIVNERLFYKSRNGVCSYDGSMPSEISYAFGEIHYSAVDEESSDPLRNGAVAGFHQNKYYLSAKSEVDNKWYLLVYDISVGLWHIEDHTRVDAFASFKNEMYYIDHDMKKIRTVLGSGTQDTERVHWMAETGVVGVSRKDGNYGSSMVGKKHVSQLLIRMSMDVGSRCLFYIQYDSSGEWEHITTLDGTSLRSFTVPVRPKRCDHFRIRVYGEGEAKIFSVTKTITQGSDL